MRSSTKMKFNLTLDLGAAQNSRRKKCPDAPRRPTDSEPTEFLCVDLEAPESSESVGNVLKRSDSRTEPKEFLDNETAFALARSNVFANKRRATRGIRATRTKTRSMRTVSCRGISRIPEGVLDTRASLSDSEVETPRNSGKLKRRPQSVRFGPRRHRSGRSLRRSGRGLKVFQH